MPRGRKLKPVELNQKERDVLEAWGRRRTTAQGLATRSRIVLLAAKGWTNSIVAEHLHITRLTVGKWRSRFLELRLDGLTDEPRPGAPRKVSDADVERVITATLERRRVGGRGAPDRLVAVLNEFLYAELLAIAPLERRARPRSSRSCRRASSTCESHTTTRADLFRHGLLACN